MQFKIGDYDVTVREGKSSTTMDVSFCHHPGLKRIYIEAPEEMMHPVYISFMKLRLKGIIDSVAKKQTMNATSRYIPNRERATKWVVRKFKSEFSKVHGDIDVAKTNWDYNKAPEHSNTGKYGDLKAFCGMRKGQELELVKGGTV
jgi:hypothetical protein